MTTLPAVTLVEFPHAPANALISTYSPACQKAHYALRYAGIAYTSERHQNPDTLAAENPAKQFPFLRVGGTPLPDSTAILRWVCAQSEAGAAGAPTEERTAFYLADPAKRAEAWLWEEFADASLYGFVIASRWASDENFARVRSHLFAEMPAALRMVVPQLIRRGLLKRLVMQDVTRAGLDETWRRMRDQLAALDARAPDDGFWLSSKPSVADVALAAMLNNLRTDVTPAQREWTESHVRLRNYLDRCAEAMQVPPA